VRFKIDVSDRETGEVATVDVDAPTAGAARRYLRDAGYMVWATQPAGDVPDAHSSRDTRAAEGLDWRVREAEHGHFRIHPVRRILAPACRWAAGILVWLSAATWTLHLDLSRLPWGFAPTAANLACAAVLLWAGGLWIGWPVARGQAALRTCADREIVCRYCRRRGNVRTFTRFFTRRRLWGQCRTCGIRWLF
jgi:hypothetical protein